MHKIVQSKETLNKFQINAAVVRIKDYYKMHI